MSTAVKTKAPQAPTALKKGKMTGSEAVIQALLHEGVDTIFGYPGGAIMPIYDALYDYQDQVNHVLVRHEQGATHAAQGYARVTGKVGVCFATSGPGATNLITGIADACIDSTPMVCITGQVVSALLGTDAFQETDVIGISMPVTKWNYQVTSAEEIPAAIAKAFFLAKSGRPGPVVVDITKDAQFGELDFQYKPCKQVRSYVPAPKLDMEEVKKAAELLNNAQRPYILAGHGILISGATDALQKVAEKAGIPVASTLLGLSAFPPDHPLYVGMLGMHGNYGPNILTNSCDVLLAVGMRFDDRVTGKLSTYAKQAKVIHIEIDPAEIHKNVKADVPVNADAKLALEALLPLLEKQSHPEWLAEFEACTKKEEEKVTHEALNPTGDELRMSEVVNMLSEMTKGEAIVVTDVGQHQMIGARFYKFRKPDSNVTSGGLGTMGFALPAALGAKIGRPDREVVAIIGDGGFQMTLQEMATIFQTKAAVKVVILNNNFLGMVRQWQQLFFEKRYSFTEMTNPNFVALSKAFGVESERVSERDGLQQAIKNMLDHDGPYLLEVMVEKEDNVFPMVPAGACLTEIKLEK
ncbi:MAG: biosynthetic-type acetolactate synthase large subunit [Flavobacteriales bacterium]|nr:biosynthetic-type acetolactate synthase large subunit [Flavobacteriales bacterium]MCB9448070.1 biosynthetic-type acetolactate synthase large subunit [Flavobacteriales bacterium]